MIQHLEKELKSELSGRFEDVAIATLTDTPTLNAKYLRKAMEGAGTVERLLYQILAIGSNTEIQATAQAYRARKLLTRKYFRQ